MKEEVSMDSLIRKYDVPVPRYTSYPTVPYWEVDNFNLEQWKSAIKKCFEESNETKGVSLYIHLPFCESLCTYCACNTRITKNHAVENPYINALLKEWEAYREIFGGTPVLRELHLGGGTPTFFNPENLKKLLAPILQNVLIHPDYEFSFEGHPNNTTKEHLQALFDQGFRRVSFGVQDLDINVQRAIHRIQPFENLERDTRLSREIGYESVSFDLIYGLPHQTRKSVTNTIQKVITLKPDRIAFYSYAHVPWMKPGQRGYEDADLPSDVEKRLLYETGRKLFQEAGYLDIGMDHFALPDDSLAIAYANGTLHRNFMGYTTSQTDLLIGLGVSAISDAKYAYAQNLKKVEEYETQIQKGDLTTFKGHLQTPKDILLRRCILDIACQGKLDFSLLQQVSDDAVQRELNVMTKEGIIEKVDSGIRVTETGRAFIRNICSVFDSRMRSKQFNQQIFSKSI